MNKYVLIKIGGSSLMLSMICKLIGGDGNNLFIGKMLDGMLVIKFESEKTRAELSQMLDDMNLVNYFLAREGDMHCSLTEKVDEHLNLNKNVQIEDPEDIQKAINIALEEQEYEKAAQLRDRLKELRSKNADNQ